MDILSGGTNLTPFPTVAQRAIRCEVGEGARLGTDLVAEPGVLPAGAVITVPVNHGVAPRSTWRSRFDHSSQLTAPSPCSPVNTSSPSPAAAAPSPASPTRPLPDELSRRLFDALRLETRYDHTTRSAACRITLTRETIDAVGRTTNETVVVPMQRRRKDQQREEREVETVSPATVALTRAFVLGAV